MRESQRPTATGMPLWRLLRNVVLTAALSAAQALFTSPLAAAQGRTLEIASFHSDIMVLANGSLDVTETIVVRPTGSWNGIFRQIPVEYRTSYGANYTLRIGVQSVQDDSGSDLRYETERAGRNHVFKIWVPGANNATRTILFRYSVANGLRFFEEHDELYWNVMGDESEYPILAASARVVLPPAAYGARSTAFASPPGSVQSNIRISEAVNSVEFETDRTL